MAVACGTFQARGGPADDESSVCFGLLQLWKPVLVYERT
jgi:hypothetical protein